MKRNDTFTHTKDWDIYYLTLCYVVAQKSKDLSTKCGAVIVSDDNRILSTGYNGPIRNSNDSNFPTKRPEKYYHTLHAEENALLMYSGSCRDIFGATIYVTGMPCHKCLRMIIQKGISRVVFCKGHLAKMQDDVDLEASLEMIDRYYGELVLDEIDVADNIMEHLKNTEEYDKTRLTNEEVRR